MTRSIIVNCYHRVIASGSGIVLLAGLAVVPLPITDAVVPQLTERATQLQVSATVASLIESMDNPQPLEHLSTLAPDALEPDAVELPLNQTNWDTHTTPATAIDFPDSFSWDSDTAGGVPTDDWMTEAADTTVTRSVPEALLNVAISFGTMVVLAPINIVLSPLALLIPLALPFADTSSCQYLACAVAPLIFVGLIAAVTVGPAAVFLSSLYELWNAAFPAADSGSTTTPTPSAAEPESGSAAATPFANQSDTAPALSESDEGGAAKRSDETLKTEPHQKVRESAETWVIGTIGSNVPSLGEGSPSSRGQTSDPSPSREIGATESAVGTQQTKRDAVRSVDSRNQATTRQNQVARAETPS